MIDLSTAVGVTAAVTVSIFSTAAGARASLGRYTASASASTSAAVAAEVRRNRPPVDCPPFDYFYRQGTAAVLGTHSSCCRGIHAHPWLLESSVRKRCRVWTRERKASALAASLHVGPVHKNAPQQRTFSEPFFLRGLTSRPRMAGRWFHSSSLPGPCSPRGRWMPRVPRSLLASLCGAAYSCPPHRHGSPLL